VLFVGGGSGEFSTKHMVLGATLICKVAREFCNFPSKIFEKVFFGLISLPGRRNSLLTPDLEVQIFRFK
jgi:hypothetical protein